VRIHNGCATEASQQGAERSEDRCAERPAKIVGQTTPSSRSVGGGFDRTPRGRRFRLDTRTHCGRRLHRPLGGR